MTRMRWATFLMGAWVAGSLAVSVVASENFYTIDWLLAASTNGTFRSITTQLGSPHDREFLRYLSSELNRLYFQWWNGAQLVLGLAVLWLVGPGSDRTRPAGPASSRVQWAVAVMLTVVVLMFVWLAPEITSVGRSLDFVPRTPTPPALGRFGILHATYATLEVAKMVVGVAAAIWMTRLEAPREADRRVGREDT